MGILDETATEDDYLAPEYDVLADLGNWATTPIEGFNAPNIIQNESVSNAFGDFSDAAGRTSDFSFDNMYNLPAMIAGGASWLGEQASDMWSKVFGGEDLSPLDTLEALGVSGVGAAKGVRGVGNAISNQASGLGITRGSMPYDPKNSGKLGWYDGPVGKAKEMGKMVGSLSSQMIKNLYDPKAHTLWNKYGISDVERKELTKVIADMKTNPSKRQHRNHIISQMQSNKTLRDKFGNETPAFIKDFEKVLFPKSLKTNGGDLVDSSVPINTVLPDVPLPPDAIRDHMSAPMVQKLGMEGANNIQLQTKVWEGNPIQEMGFKNTKTMPDGKRYIKQMEQPQFQGLTNRKDIKLDLSKKGRSTLAKDAQKKFIKAEHMFPSSTQSAWYLWKTAPEGSKFDLDGFNDLLKYNNTRYMGPPIEGKGLQQGRFMVDPFDLSGEMIDSGNYISFGGKRLGEDKLLGTYDSRFIIDKRTGDGYLFIYDEMQLGSPSKKLDRAVLGGNQEQVYVDFYKLERGSGNSVSGGESSATLQRGIDSKDLADELSVSLTDILENGVTAQDIAKFKDTRKMQVATGTAGIGLLNYDENE